MRFAISIPQDVTDGAFNHLQTKSGEGFVSSPE